MLLRICIKFCSGEVICNHVCRHQNRAVKFETSISWGLMKVGDCRGELRTLLWMAPWWWDTSPQGKFQKCHWLCSCPQALQLATQLHGISRCCLLLVLDLCQYASLQLLILCMRCRTVIEVGPGVKRLKVGDRVAIEPGVPCWSNKASRYAQQPLYLLP